MKRLRVEFVKNKFLVSLQADMSIEYLKENILVLLNKFYSVSLSYPVKLQTEDNYDILECFSTAVLSDNEKVFLFEDKNYSQRSNSPYLFGVSKNTMGSLCPPQQHSNNYSYLGYFKNKLGKSTAGDSVDSFQWKQEEENKKLKQTDNDDRSISSTANDIKYHTNNNLYTSTDGKEIITEDMRFKLPSTYTYTTSFLYKDAKSSTEFEEESSISSYNTNKNVNVKRKFTGNNKSLIVSSSKSVSSDSTSSTSHESL